MKKNKYDLRKLHNLLTERPVRVIVGNKYNSGIEATRVLSINEVEVKDIKTGKTFVLDVNEFEGYGLVTENNEKCFQIQPSVLDMLSVKKDITIKEHKENDKEKTFLSYMKKPNMNEEKESTVKVTDDLLEGKREFLEKISKSNVNYEQEINESLNFIAYYVNETGDKRIKEIMGDVLGLEEIKQFDNDEIEKILIETAKDDGFIDRVYKNITEDKKLYRVKQSKDIQKIVYECIKYIDPLLVKEITLPAILREQLQHKMYKQCLNNMLYRR